MMYQCTLEKIKVESVSGKTELFSFKQKFVHRMFKMFVYTVVWWSVFSQLKLTQAYLDCIFDNENIDNI